MKDADHIKCNKEDLLKCDGLFAAWKLGAVNALEQSKSTQVKSKTKMTYEEARKILHPDTTLQALAEIEYYAGFGGQEAKIKAVEEACSIACEALDVIIKNNQKPIEKMITVGCLLKKYPNCSFDLMTPDGYVSISSSMIKISPREEKIQGHLGNHIDKISVNIETLLSEVVYAGTVNEDETKGNAITDYAKK